MFLYYFDKLTELKAEHWEKEKELRQKIVQIQKEQAEWIENLQVDNFVWLFSAKPGHEVGVIYNYLGGVP